MANIQRPLPSTNATPAKPGKNFLVILAAQAFNALADALASAKTVLPWLMQAVGAPTFLTGLLVPVRESGSLLPQVFIGGMIQRLARRKFAYAAGLFLQALSCALIALVAFVSSGWWAGLMILGLSACLALARAVCSICSKDVLGKTISDGKRGKLLGLGGSIAGGIAVAIGLLLLLKILHEHINLIFLLIGATAAWLTASLIILWLDEPRGETAKASTAKAQLQDSLDLFTQDPTFRLFIGVRALLMSSGLSAPYLVLLAQPSDLLATEGNQIVTSIQTLGALVALTGLASLISSSLWGRLADKDSKYALAFTALVTGFLCASAAIVAQFTPPRSELIILALFFLLSVTHQGVRLARKTYVIDIAEGNLRTRYVATSNSAIGVLLLLVGFVSAVVAQWSLVLVLGLFALMACFALWLTRYLPQTKPSSTS